MEERSSDDLLPEGTRGRGSLVGWFLEAWKHLVEVVRIIDVQLVGSYPYDRTFDRLVFSSE